MMHPASDAQLATASVTLDLMPPMSQIPAEYTAFPGRTRWHQLFTDLFYRGVAIQETIAKPGIDAAQAWKHLLAIARSFAPKHEHKEAACAYLMSLWFEDVQYTTKERER